MFHKTCSPNLKKVCRKTDRIRWNSYHLFLNLNCSTQQREGQKCSEYCLLEKMEFFKVTRVRERERNTIIIQE